MSARNSLTKFLHQDETNRVLLNENKKLRDKLPENYIRKNSDEIIVNDTVYEQQYTYTPATVIQSTFDKRNNYLTINIGRAQGIKKGMGVFSDGGIVGQVFQVSEHFSLVKSFFISSLPIKPDPPVIR